MKIVAISDTHTRHKRIDALGGIPECDILIHAGDFSWTGEYDEVVEFTRWFENQPARYKIVIAGNHELTFDCDSRRFDPRCRAILADHPHPDIFYLDNEAVILEGIKFYGTPWTPWFCDWGFNGYEGSDIPFKRGLMLDDIYGDIPEDTQVLICHGPPYDLLDKSIRDNRCGSKVMRKFLEGNRFPKLTTYICGHIHESRGHVVSNGVHICNVSTLDFDYETARSPVILNLDDDGLVSSIEGY